MRDESDAPLLAGKYRLTRQLGAGGMGSVYEGVHQVTGRRVAVKLLHPQLAADPELVERFLNEARAAALLGHPHIVECLDAGTAADGQPYLVLEFLEGRSLAEELAVYGALEPGRAVRIALQVVSALSAAHARGVVHRDLKPENVFLSQRPGAPDHATVLDFGISRFHGASALRTRAGTMMGTPAYMAPEQMADASQADARADVYALGVTLYQVLTGSLPFQADSLVALAVKIAQEPPPPLARRRPGLPPGLCAAVERALAKAPAGRFATMDAFGAALAPFAGAAPLGSQPPLQAFHIDETAQPRPSPLPGPAPLRPARAASVTRGIALGLGLAGLLGAGLYAALGREAAPVEVAAPRPAPARPAAPAPATPPEPEPVVLGATRLEVAQARPNPERFTHPLLLPPHRLLAEHLSADELQRLHDLSTSASLKQVSAPNGPFVSLASRLARPVSGPVDPVRQLAYAWVQVRRAMELARLGSGSAPDFALRRCADSSLVDLSAPLEASRAEGGALSRAERTALGLWSEYLAGAAGECAWRREEAEDHFLRAVELAASLEAQARQEGASGPHRPGQPLRAVELGVQELGALRLDIALRRMRLALAAGEPARAGARAEELPSGARRDAAYLTAWARALSWSCSDLLAAMREATPPGFPGRPWPELDAAALACIADPGSDLAGRDPGRLDPAWSDPANLPDLAAARRAFDEAGLAARPAAVDRPAALRAALRLCYFRDRLARPAEVLQLRLGGRLERPELGGAPTERTDPLAQCLGARLGAAGLRGPIAPARVELVSAEPPRKD